ncbi:MAG TPA: PEP-CTERM sorting domain-containing protein, partial [Planctomycetota bacterium]|nr:PEP-CTERM sorting domain-containing protein [Planctomycetota bacterium]
GYAYVTGDSAYRAFLWVDADNDRAGDPGEMRDLGTLEVGGNYGLHSKAWAVSNDDHVVGEAQIPNGSMRAFIWEDNTMTNLGALIGANSSCARDLNEAVDTVVGYSMGTTSAPTVWTKSGGTWSKSQLPKLVLGNADAYGINDNGQIVGYSMSSDPLGAHAVIWENGIITDLNSVIVNLPDNVIVVQAQDINNYGVIVATCSVPTGEGYRYTHACILTPVQTPIPEPATMLLVAAGTGGFMWLRRRRR